MPTSTELVAEKRWEVIGNEMDHQPMISMDMEENKKYAKRDEISV